MSFIQQLSHQTMVLLPHSLLLGITPLKARTSDSSTIILSCVEVVVLLAASIAFIPLFRLPFSVSSSLILRNWRGSYLLDDSFTKLNLLLTIVYVLPINSQILYTFLIARLSCISTSLTQSMATLTIDNSSQTTSLFRNKKIIRPTLVIR